MRPLVGVLILSMALAAPPPAPLGLDLFRPTPPGNPLTAAKIALGRRLFHEARFSASGAMSCASCHTPARAFTNGRVIVSGPRGITVRRNVPSLINRAYGASFFWDGRAASLEEQVVQPLVEPREMAATPDGVLSIVRADGRYRRQFADAFGRAPAFEDVARALASYVRSIRSGDSPYDRFRAGDRSALTPAQRNGLAVFLAKGQCWVCHAGMNLTDERFHNTGVAFRPDAVFDPGRAAVSGKDRDQGGFKTPTLREVDRTAPYMHDGSLATLEDVVDYYDRGGAPNPNLDKLVRPIGLSIGEKADLVAFLHSLNGRVRDGS
jgi:cytochrome c peroxidase